MSYKFIFSLIYTFLIIVKLINGQTDSGLAIGDPAPHFNANDHEGRLWQSDQHYQKKYIVVYFYPAAMTGGCTKQACSYRDDQPTFTELAVEVIGISADPVANLQLFRAAHHLNFTLLSDVNGFIAQRFGVPLGEGGTIVRSVEQNDVTLNRPYTASRWTFIIDKEGKIIYRDNDVKAADDSKAVISFLKSLK